jgi:membrane-bound serine protease (ClpP class)
MMVHRVAWRGGLIILLLLAASTACAAPPSVMVIELHGVIGAASSDYVVNGLQRAGIEGDSLVVIELDTPGGLEDSMRAINSEILASSVPVAVYVTPAGARAASAGTYMLYAAHIAAMTPGTHVGAATPVQVGGLGGVGESKEMESKMTNDAVAYIRSLAALRGRNADWAEDAVRKAASIPAEEALKLHAIDYIAPDLPSLLATLEGVSVTAAGMPRTLALKGARVTPLPQGWSYRLLAFITDPNIAYLLMVIGFYGIVFELANPGYGLPGVAGAICLVLALFAFQSLPVHYVGLALILLAIALFAGEAFLPTYGSLGVGGVIAFILGSIFLMGNVAPGISISLSLIATAALLSAFVIIGVVTLAIRTRLRHVVSGTESLVGSRAVAVEDFSERGAVRVQGEVWAARTRRPVHRGDALKVTGLDGLTVIVESEQDIPPAPEK